MIRRLTIHLLAGMLTLAVALALVNGLRSYWRGQAACQNLGTENALLGARITQFMLEKAVNNGLFDRAALFDSRCELVDDHDRAHYHTEYDHFFDRNVATILRAFRANADIYYAYVINKDGFVAAHTDKRKSKTKQREGSDAFSAAAVGGDTHERLVKSDGHKFFEFCAPILVGDRMWGEFRVGIPVALVNNRGRGSAVNTFVITIAVSLIAVMAIVFSLRRSMRPLNELTHATREMAAGKGDVRCSYDGRDELGVLAQSFNVMAETIAQTHEGLEAQVRTRTTQLVEHEESYRRFFADNRAVMLQVDGADAVIIAANNAAVEFYGYPMTQLIGMPLERINILPREDILAAISAAREVGGRRFEFRHRLADGNLRDVEVYISVIQNSEREVCHSIIHDITDRKHMEAARLRAEHLRRSLLDNSAVGIFHSSPDRIILEVSARACAMFGYSREEMQGQSFRLLHLSDERFREFGRQYARLTDPEVAAVAFPFRRKDGSALWCSAYATRFDETDVAKGYIWTFVDISALRDTQALARRLSRAVEQTSTSVVMTDLQGNITFVNRGFCRTSGYCEPDVLGKNQRLLEAAEVPASVPEEVWRALSRGQQWRGELRSRRKTGDVLWESVVIAPVADEEGNTTHFVAVREDITDRKRDEEILRDTRDAAEAANRAKSEFLANMSHEIRTPMTAILGYADILSESSVHPDQQEAIETIQRNGNHLLTVINDILDLSKIEAGKVSVDHLPASPLSLVGDVVSLMRVRAEAKGLRLSQQCVGPVPETIVTDPTRLRQILVNLVGNAIKFTEVGEVKVVLRLIVDDTAVPMLQCDVIDSGMGVSAHQSARLFQPFQQGDASTTRRFGGTGLGLAISKRLANLLGGDLALESQLGKGSRFTLTVATGPLEGIALVHQSAESAPPAVPKPSQGANQVTQLPGRVLLAEDGPDNQRLIAFILRKTGTEVQICENGQVAMERALASMAADDSPSGDRETPYDLILMDMQMPVMDGYEATRRLRQQGYVGPIVALTAHAMKDDMQKCLDAGCDAYLTKPISRDSFLSTLARYLKRAQPAPLA